MWRSAQYWSAGTYHFTINLQAGIKINGTGKEETERFYLPNDAGSLASSVKSDDYKPGFFIGARFNYDLPVKITGKTKE